MYHINGQLMSKHRYNKDGNRDGTWEFFNFDGSSRLILNYKDGKLIE